MSSSPKSNILVLMSGSIAAFKACQVLSKLAQAGHRVQVVASPSLLKFVGAATIEGLTGLPVLSDLWERGHAMDHIHEVRRADLILVMPASAHFLNRAAHGVGDDLLTTMFLAHDFKKPFLVAPAMNTAMYLHPATQESLKRLREMGVQVLEAASGVLACGETGYGRLLEPDLLLQEIQAALKSSTAGKAPAETSTSRVTSRPSSRAPRVLITAGGTQEPIDDVRVLANTSSGRSGARLADELSSLGLDVFFLGARSGAKPTDPGIATEDFVTVEDLGSRLRARLSEGGFTHVIQMAAVSDYRVSRRMVDGVEVKSNGKIPSGRPLTIELEPTPKLIAQLREWDPKVHVAGFKLTSGANAEARHAAAEKVLAHAEIVIGNDLSEIDEGRGVHPYVLHRRDGVRPLAGFPDMAAALAEWIFSSGSEGRNS